MCYMIFYLHHLPCQDIQDKKKLVILDLTGLKAFADSRVTVPHLMNFLFDRVEHIVAKGEKNAGYLHFLLFPQYFLTHYHTIPQIDSLKIYSCGIHCEKRRFCLLQAISPFFTMFSSLDSSYFSF